MTPEETLTYIIQRMKDIEEWSVTTRKDKTTALALDEWHFASMRHRWDELHHLLAELDEAAATERADYDPRLIAPPRKGNRA